MKPVFVDTAGWMMLADASDTAHKQAVAFRDAWLKGGGVLVSTDFVMDETLTLLRTSIGNFAAVFARSPRKSLIFRPSVSTVVPIQD